MGGPSEAERAAQESTTIVAYEWNRLDPEAMGRWRRYAELQTAARPSERRTVTNGWNEYLALGKKLVQIDPLTEIPESPPTGRFLGDLVSFGVETYAGRTPPLPLPRGEGEEEVATPRGEGEEEVATPRGEGDVTPTLPSPRGQGSGICFLASRPNDEGVLTEFLLQRLANGGRLPTTRGYRSQGFLSVGEDLRVEVPADPGWWACATRFVEASTGRATDLTPCGVVFGPPVSRG